MSKETEPGDDVLDGDSIIAVPISDEIDLHTFAPSDVPSLVDEYLSECARLGLRVVRVVHGKGTGTLRRTVHAALARHPLVESYALGGPNEGGWGATVVKLKSD